MTAMVERGRLIALEIAIALMLISGITPLAGFGVGIEHMPYGIAVAILLAKRPPLAFIIPVAFATLFWGFSHFYWGEWTNWKFLVQFINVLTPMVFFRDLWPRIERTARVVFWVYIAFGLLQMFKLLVFAEPFFENLIPRFRGQTENGYRGVASLESEPARAAFQLFMLFIIGRKKFVNQHVAFGAMILAQLLLLRATTGLMLTAVLLGFLVLAAVRHRPKLAPVLLIATAAVSVVAYTQNPKIEEIADQTFQRGWTGFDESITATSGGRWLALRDSVSDIVEQPLGRGADPSTIGDALLLLEENGYTDKDGLRYEIEQAPRPVSAILNAMRQFGVVMLFMVAWAIRETIFQGRRPDYTAYFWFVIACGLVYGPSGSEALILALGFAGGAAQVAASESDEARVDGSDSDASVVRTLS